jgi:hypothetical protein
LDNGWTDDFIYSEWFRKGFVPAANTQNLLDQLILLIYDGNRSYTTVEIINSALENNIHLFCLPPHTIHQLQPLDVSVFGPLQRAWFNWCDQVLEETGEVMGIRNVVREYICARAVLFKSEIILQGWCKTGI